MDVRCRSAVRWAVLFAGTALLLALAAAFLRAAPAQAHRDGCHRWHSCPSDTGSYTCGDLGYTSECGYGGGSGGGSSDTEPYDDEDLGDDYPDESLDGYSSSEDDDDEPGDYGESQGAAGEGSEVDVWAHERAQAQEKLDAAQRRLSEAQAALPPAQAEADRRAAVYAPLRARATRARRRAEQASLQATGARDDMRARRLRLLRRVDSKRAAYADSRDRWRAAQAGDLGLAVAVLVLALLLGTWSLLLKRGRSWRQATERRRWAGWVAAGATACALAAAIALLAAGGLQRDVTAQVAPIALAAVVAGVGAALWWASGRTQPAARRPPIVRVWWVPSAILTLGGAVALAATGVTRSAPVPPLISAQHQLIAERAERDPAAHPTARVTQLTAKAERLGAQAGRAERRAAAASSQARAADDELQRTGERIDRAERSVAHWAERVEDPALMLEGGASGGGGGGGSGADGGYNCDDFASQEEAQEHADSNGDADGLDGDSDGVACESLP